MSIMGISYFGCNSSLYLLWLQFFSTYFGCNASLPVVIRILHGTQQIQNQSRLANRDYMQAEDEGRVGANS